MRSSISWHHQTQRVRVTLRLLLTLVLAACVGGCASHLSEIFNRPIVENTLITSKPRVPESADPQELATLSVTAQRRIIIANLSNGTYCAEPPPEAADSVTSAITAALTAQLGSDREINANLASNFARYVNQLYKRAHTVQLFRDAAFHLCVDAVNYTSVLDTAGVLKDKSNEWDSYYSYTSEVQYLVKMLIPTLRTEIELYYEAEIARANSLHPPSDRFIVCNSTAAIEGSDDGDQGGLSTSITCMPLVDTNEVDPDQSEAEETDQAASESDEADADSGGSN